MTTDAPTRPELDPAGRRRLSAQARHATALGSLMARRDDLRGVYAFADYVDDAVRWSV